MKAYLDIDVPSDREGILQDVHWSSGMFDISQLMLWEAPCCANYYAMKRDFDVEDLLVSGNTQAINEWLKQRLRHGSTKTANNFFWKQPTNHLTLNIISNT